MRGSARRWKGEDILLFVSEFEVLPEYFAAGVDEGDAKEVEQEWGELREK